MKRALLLFLAFTAAWLAGCDKQDDGPAPELTLSGGTVSGRSALEVIEDLNPTGPVRVSLKLKTPVRSVRLVPAGIGLPFRISDGRIEFEVPSFTCHQMVELAY